MEANMLGKLDYEQGSGWAYAVIERDDKMQERIVARCTTVEARDAAYRLLSGQCEKRDGAAG
jgi:hypothetical protein